MRERDAYWFTIKDNLIKIQFNIFHGYYVLLNPEDYNINIEELKKYVESSSMFNIKIKKLILSNKLKIAALCLKDPTFDNESCFISFLAKKKGNIDIQICHFNGQKKAVISYYGEIGFKQLKKLVIDYYNLFYNADIYIIDKKNNIDQYYDNIKSLLSYIGQY